MKQRLLVMNGQKLLQSEQAGQWSTVKVEKAGAIKPGIYALHLSTQADKARSYEGVVLHADVDYLYQQVGKTLIRHQRADFAKLPEVGSSLGISYEAGWAVAVASSVKRSRGLSR